MTTQSPLIPELQIPGMGPCGKPCEHPCDTSCDEHGEAQPSLWTRWMKASWINALDVCFDDVYQEPKRILMIGGCRQRDFAQHIALLLPTAEIFVLDPDAEEARKAQEEVCCRFKFVTAPLEALPFEEQDFDLTIAHNLFSYAENWEQALHEACRVTRKNLLFSHHRPLVWGLFKSIKSLSQSLCELGSLPEARIPDNYEMLSRVYMHGKVKTKLAPFPWTVYMTEMKPLREERTIL